MEIWRPVAEAYAAFAREAADSPCFAAWSAAIAEDPDVLARIGGLPAAKQQPTLVLAAARWHGVPAPGPYAALRDALLGERWPAVRQTVLERSTQTNEAGRLATLVPAFATVGAPLALLEVGASAGLCLHPDGWGYDWSGTRVGPDPVLPCTVTGPAPLPGQVPEVAWRAGIDLNPLDVDDPDAMAWLEQLVWPEQDERRERLRRAVEVARQHPVRLVAGHLLDRLPALLAEAPRDAVPVVFHTAVVAYLRPDERHRFEVLMLDLVAEGRCHWVSNEAPNVLPGVAASAPAELPARTPFLLGIDGRAVAATHGHGRFLHWFA